jgi:hypothetical protein
VGVLAGSTIGANDRDGRARHLDSVSSCVSDSIVDTSRLQKVRRSTFPSSCKSVGVPVHAVGSYRSALGKQRLPLVRSALSKGRRHGQSDRLDLAIMDRLQLTHENHN